MNLPNSSPDEFWDTTGCWVGDTFQVVHLTPDGAPPLRVGLFSHLVRSVSVDPNDGSCWVTTTGERAPRSGEMVGSAVYHVAADGTILSRSDEFWAPRVSVNPADGSCWVTDLGRNQIVHLGADSTELLRIGMFNEPRSVSVNPSDGSCWVGDWRNQQVVHVAEDGTELLRLSGFWYTGSVSVDPDRGYCWVADRNNKRVVRVDPCPPEKCYPSLLRASFRLGALVSWRAWK